MDKRLSILTLIFIFSATTILFSSEENSKKPNLNLSKRDIYRHWLIPEASMKGEMSTNQGEEALPLELRERIQKAFREISRVSFTCPSVEEITNDEGTVLYHDGIPFAKHIKTQVPILFHSVQLNGDDSTPRCAYVKNGNFTAGNALPLPSKTLTNCTVQGGTPHLLNQHILTYYTASNPQEIKVTCEQW